MIQMMKKPVSIFLAVLMIFSCFSGMSLTALAADEVSENISLVASDSSNLKTISGTHYSVSCGYMSANSSGMQVCKAGALTINARKGETITKVVLTYSWGNNKSSLSASAGTFDGNATISDINAQQVTISSSNTAGVKISAVRVYFEGDLNNPTVTLTGGANAKSSGGLLTQSYLPGAMDTVTYTALTGAAFPEFETYTLNGVTVERTSDTVVTISGTPTANTEITVPDAESSSKIVTWNSATISSISSSITKDYTYTANGITLNKTGKGKFANNNITGYDSTASFEFTTATGKFTSIEIETSEIYNGGNWTKDGNTLKWNGTPSNSVSLSGSGLYLEGVSSITFVIKPNTYTVTWQNEDGSVLETDTDVAEGTVPTYDGATPNKADDAQYTYTFAGWTPEVVAATQDVTYIAQFTQVAKFSVFVKKLTGGTITVSNVTGLTTVAQLKDLLVTETGVPASAMRLIFAGKQLADDKTLGEYNIQKESTLHLIIRTYTITWKSDEATIIDTTNVAYGETPTHEDPATYEDADYTYTFAGWSPEVAAVTGEATYTATYTATPKATPVAEANGVKYESFDEALRAISTVNAKGQFLANGTVRLLADCAGNGYSIASGSNLIIDFNGKTYTVNSEPLAGSTGTKTQAFQLLKDSTVIFKNGTLYSEVAKMLVQNYSDLTLEGMTLTLDNPNYHPSYTLSNNNGDTMIIDSTINANPAGGFAFDVCRYSSYPSVSVTVTGDSEINGDVEIFASKGDPKEGLSLNLNGGTMSGNIVLDSTVQDIIENENVEVKKAAAFTKEAPEGYAWNEEGVLVIDATAELKGRSVSIADEASINYYVAVNDAYSEAYGDTAYVQFTVGGTTTKAMLKDAPTQDVNGVLCYKFSINVKVSEMDKVVSAALYKNDGDASPVVFADYSINAYIAQAIDYFAGNENLVKVLKALRAYGSYMAVAFKGAEHFDAVTADEKAAIEAVNASDIEPYNVDNKNLPSGIEFVSANLSISDTLALNMYFNGDISAYNCKCVDDTIAVVEDGAYEKATIGGLGGSYIDNVFVLNIGEEYYVSYSPISYAYTYLTSVSDADAMSNALRAMFVYAEASSAYFGR